MGFVKGAESDEVIKEKAEEYKNMTEAAQHLSALCMKIEKRMDNQEQMIKDLQTQIRDLTEAPERALDSIRASADATKKELAGVVEGIKAVNTTKNDDTNWLNVGIVAVVVFVLMLAASAIPAYYWRYVPGNDYAFISFFNDTVASNGKDGDLVIELGDTTSEMNRKINEFYKRERERRQ